jgi:glycosyltransferase involved in cell wall biosynthesis
MTHINKINKDILKTKNKNNSLVSIIVITYNSANFVVETLNSVKDQSYKNIELIISDDCSTDNTVEICKGWIDKNTDRFVRTRLITVGNNGGIPANCNRGLNEAKGDWVRIIAGDDALCREAVEDSVKFGTSNKYVNILTSNKAIYNNTFSEENLIAIPKEIEVKNEKGLNFYELSNDQQYLSLLYSNKVNTCGMLIKRKLLMEIGGFDERIKYLEDYPLVLKITKYGEKIYCMDKLTIKYRNHESSVQIIKNGKNIIFNDQYKTIQQFRKLYIYPNVNLLNRIIFKFEYYRHYFIDFAKLNRNNLLCRGIYRITELISPWKIRRFYYRKRY